MTSNDLHQDIITYKSYIKNLSKTLESPNARKHDLTEIQKKLTTEILKVLTSRDRVQNQLNQNDAVDWPLLQALQAGDEQLKKLIYKARHQYSIDTAALHRLYPDTPSDYWWWRAGNSRFLTIIGSLCLFVALLATIYTSYRVIQLQFDMIGVILFIIQALGGVFVVRSGIGRISLCGVKKIPYNFDRQSWSFVIDAVLILIFALVIPIGVLPNIANLIYQRGQAEAEFGNTKAALDYYILAVRFSEPSIFPFIIQSDAASKLTQMGIALAEGGKLNSAIDAYEYALQADPRLLVALVELANLSTDRGDYLTATRLAQQAHDFSTKHLKGNLSLPTNDIVVQQYMIKSYIVLARIYLNTGHYQLAEDNLNCADNILQNNINGDLASKCNSKTLNLDISEAFIEISDVVNTEESKIPQEKRNGDVTELYYLRGFVRLNLNRIIYRTNRFSQIRDDFRVATTLARYREETPQNQKWLSDMRTVIDWIGDVENLNPQELGDKLWPILVQY